MTLILLAAVLLALSSRFVSAQDKPNFDFNSLPDQSEPGQTGTNRCTADGPQSNCQTLMVDGIDNLCLFAPPQPSSVVGATEEIEVVWCSQAGRGARLIPDGTFSSMHAVLTPDYYQVSGRGDLTKINVQAGDAGGELGNPIGGLVYSSVWGSQVQIKEWTSFISAEEYCIRICNPDRPNAAALCQHIYDVMGCEWNMPGNYAPSGFETCEGDTGEPMGVYGGSTFHQGDAQTPGPHPAPATSNCVTGMAPISGMSVSSASMASSLSSAGMTSLTLTTSASPSSMTTSVRPASSRVNLAASTTASTKNSGAGQQRTATGAGVLSGLAVALLL